MLYIPIELWGQGTLKRIDQNGARGKSPFPLGEIQRRDCLFVWPGLVLPSRYLAQAIKRVMAPPSPVAINNSPKNSASDPVAIWPALPENVPDSRILTPTNDRAALTKTPAK